MNWIWISRPMMRPDRRLGDVPRRTPAAGGTVGTRGLPRNGSARTQRRIDAVQLEVLERPKEDEEALENAVHDDLLESLDEEEVL